MNGRRGWAHKVNIKQFLTEDAVTEEIGQNVVAELKKADPFQGEDAADILYDLLDAAKEGDTELFNYMLDAVYDYADEHRVWLGL